MRSECCTPTTPTSDITVVVGDAGEEGWKSSRRFILYQIGLGVVANLGSISPGMTLGFSAVALPQLQNQNATFYMDDNQASWMASLATLFTAAGCILVGSLMDNFGRRNAMLILNIPGFIGWLLIAFAYGEQTLGLIYAGRILTGLATGMASSVPAVYSAEISSDSIRSVLVTWTSIAVSLGVLLVYIFGSVFHENWRLTAGCSAVFPALSFLLVYFILPESPTWLAAKGRLREANSILMKTKGETRDDIGRSGVKPTRSLVFKQFFTRHTLKPLLIMNFFFFFQQFSGVFVVIFYAVDIVQDAGVTFDPYISAIIIGLTRLIVTILVSIFSKMYGRRPLAIISGAGMTLCMGILATFLYISTLEAIDKNTLNTLFWIPIISLTFYILTSTIGFLTLPWAMVGEIFPNEVRGFAAGFTTCMAYLFSFIIVKIYPFMHHHMERYGVFFFYGVISLFGTLFVVLFLPETKNRVLPEICNSNTTQDVKEQEPLNKL